VGAASGGRLNAGGAAIEARAEERIVSQVESVDQFFAPRPEITGEFPSRRLHLPRVSPKLLREKVELRLRLEYTAGIL